jgi:hypothetical protein
MAIQELFPGLDLPLRGLNNRRERKLYSIPGEGIQPLSKEHRRIFAAILSVTFAVGLLVLLAINILLTQDAFVLQHLKQETNITLDQRDALVQQLAAKSSPDQLAASAISLGMIPADAPKFIDLNSGIETNDSTSHSGGHG